MSQHILDCGQLEVNKGVFSSTCHFLKTGVNQFCQREKGKGKEEEGRKGEGRKERRKGGREGNYG